MLTPEMDSWIASFESELTSSLTEELAKSEESVRPIQSYLSTIETLYGKIGLSGNEEKMNQVFVSVTQILRHASIYAESGARFHTLAHGLGVDQRNFLQELQALETKLGEADRQCENAIHSLNVIVKQVIGQDQLFAWLPSDPREISPKDLRDISFNLSFEYTNYAESFLRTVERVQEKGRENSDHVAAHTRFSKVTSDLASIVIEDYTGLSNDAQKAVFPGDGSRFSDLSPSSPANIRVVKALPKNIELVPITTTLPVYDFQSGEHKTLLLQNAYQAANRSAAGHDVLYVFADDWDKITQEGDPIVRGKIYDRASARSGGKLSIQTKFEVHNDLESFGYDLHATAEVRAEAISAYIEEYRDDPKKLQDLESYFVLNINLQKNHPKQTETREETVDNCIADLSYLRDAIKSLNISSIHRHVEHQYESVSLSVDAMER